jgi:hypothetical protein
MVAVQRCPVGPYRAVSFSPAWSTGPAGEGGSIACESRQGGRWLLVSGSEAAAEVPVEDLRYKMIMALNAADIGNPICEQAAQICAEIAEQYCAELHITTTAQVIAAGQRAASQALPSRA